MEFVRITDHDTIAVGLEISDRIALRYDGALSAALERHRDTVAEEALATSVARGLAGRGHRWSGQLIGVSGELEIERV